MKKNVLRVCLLLSIFAVSLWLLPACQKDLPLQEPEEKEVVSATDPMPFPLDENKDLSTHPGDDFWQYCNGAWNEKTPTPATGAVGGMYSASPVMDERVDALVAEDPSLRRFFELKDNLYANSDVAEAYLTRIRGIS